MYSFLHCLPFPPNQMMSFFHMCILLFMLARLSSVYNSLALRLPMSSLWLVRYHLST